MIKYISTRGKAKPLSFEQVVMAGLASDGGLFVPDSIPQFAPHELVALAEQSYPELALQVMKPFIGDAISETDLRKILSETYQQFRHPAIAPLKQLNRNEFLLELFHGPTIAFKDFALQFLGRILEHFLERNHKQLTIIGATSGDTGSAAIEGCKGRNNMRIFILYPDGRVSDIQRKQMTTVADANVHTLAVAGTFDDCQDIVKTLFADEEFRSKQNLTAVNSINWARILAQVVYYFYAAFALGAPAKRVSFCVPTGNFGDIYAGYIAQKMGLPIEQLIIATNKNDILARCLETGVYGKESGGVHPTISPSMDIQVSSNFERLLFDLYQQDGTKIAELMQKFRDTGKIRLSDAVLAQLRSKFAASRADDNETKATIKQVYAETGELLDPHTAVGVNVARKLHKNESVPVIILATASPAKFPDAVKQASGVTPALPTHLADIMNKTERSTKIAADAKAVKGFVLTCE